MFQAKQVTFLGRSENGLSEQLVAGGVIVVSKLAWFPRAAWGFSGQTSCWNQRRECLGFLNRCGAKLEEGGVRVSSQQTSKMESNSFKIHDNIKALRLSRKLWDMIFSCLELVGISIYLYFKINRGLSDYIAMIRSIDLQQTLCKT